MTPGADQATLFREASAHDERFMRAALALGERHLGLTWPNPSVGAIVVSFATGEPVIVARGITQPSGRPHAERVALDRAGAAAKGATIYVTLEPCSHHGKTPPCAEAILASGVARVVTALSDPDPRVSGRGHALLRQAGLLVTTGVLAQEAARSHRGHMLRVTQGRPTVTLKLARTADGFAAGTGSERLMITGALATARVHHMRHHADAILVGARTVAADDPLLTVRLPGLEATSPVRVVIDSRLSTSANARIVQSAGAPQTWIVTTIDAPVEAERRLVSLGVEVMRVGADEHGRVRLDEAMRLLAVRGVTRVFCEGGPMLAEGLAQAGLVDEAVIVTATQVEAGDGLPAVGPALGRYIARSMHPLESGHVGPDLFEIHERNA
jgi:diaminohydroxyphosphoribosylaminopyrimidine deaminase / 5-amino-6-(5-phosphoribosylamino)uracil reductase